MYGFLVTEARSPCFSRYEDLLEKVRSTYALLLVDPRIDEVYAALKELDAVTVNLLHLAHEWRTKSARKYMVDARLALDYGYKLKDVTEGARACSYYSG